ncbi:zinc metalloproteinase nas-4-like [Pogonomyrmex barbatus]|uniref:Metalloendopeptidase n=1 Tax=Pogonomyrmex barbatus TaxID=144034 RepID=A0A6I9WLQ1_9HYME|nr:zinc metalloproteinase nas-4-like [Pogonomyrmex barbatus]
MCRSIIFAWALFVLTTFTSSGPVSLVDVDGSFSMIPNEESGIKVAQWTENMKMNPEELGSYLEGDIILTKDSARNGAADESLRWPNGIIPFVITGNFNAQQKALIQAAMKEYETKTCIKFVKRTNQKDYINIVSDNTGCWSYVGKIGGEQKVNLQRPGCITKIGTVIHEFLHACGFWHEQSRSDRDNYVTIIWNNIASGTENNFDKMNPNQVLDLGVGYDYSSVMHYSAYAFSKNGRKTIETKNPNAIIGQREGFSKSDIEKLNKMYKCNR